MARVLNISCSPVLIARQNTIPVSHCNIRCASKHSGKYVNIIKIPTSR